MKKVFYLILIVTLLLLGLKSCLKADYTASELVGKQTKNSTQPINFPPLSKNININGIDYLQSQAPLGKFGGELIMSTIGEGPKTFNPFNSKDATSTQMADLMFDSLFSSDAQTGAIIPKLAKSYEIKNNGKTYIVNLRKGIKWSDNVNITADDVVFTWNDIILKGFGNTSTRDSVIIDGKLPKVSKIDNYTVQFELVKPFAPFLRIVSAPIAPKHVFLPAVQKGKSYFDSFYSTTTPPKNFVTSGAFKLQEYAPAQRVVFKRNPNYYIVNTKNQRLPYLNTIVYMIVGDLNNEILKFEGKEIDVVSLKGANVARFKQKESTSDYKIYNLGADTGTLFLVFNLNNRKNKDGNYYVAPEKQYWFRDKNFRYAVDLAIDRENMVQNIANGLAKPLYTAESLNSIFLNKSLPSYPRNLEKARWYLQESGFWANKKGRLLDKFGNPVEFNLYTNAGNTEREALGVMVKQDLEDLGITVNFKPIEFNSLVNKMTNTLDWDMILIGLTGSPLEPHNGKNVWNSYGPLHLFNQRTPQTPRDDRLEFEKQLDYIFEQAALKLDFASRKALYDNYQKIVYSEKPIIYLYSPLRISALRKKIKNVYPSSLSGLLYNLEEIYIGDEK